MSVSARFYVASITKFSYNPNAATVKLQPVTRGEENRDWAAATPAGTIELVINNGRAADQFEIGKEYAISFERAPEA